MPETIGPFKIHGRLGKGGMGVVFDASSADGQRVALKLIRPVGDAERINQLIARFIREARILERLDHPSIVKLVDAGDLDGLMYLAMERIEGVSLLSVRRKGPMGYDPLVSLGMSLADALAHMHDVGVVHRDIKPANVLIRPGGRPVITDFGISGSDDVAGITRHGDLLGSPGFMAPEVTRGDPPSALSDQFALGRMIFELAAVGDPPKLLKNAPLLEILQASLRIEWHRFPQGEDWPKFEAILKRTLADEASDRFPDGHALRDALANISRATLEDVDTLSEHIEKLQLPSGHAWSVPEPQAEGAARSEEDDLLLELDRPAGERAPPRAPSVKDKHPARSGLPPTELEIDPPRSLRLTHPAKVASQDEGRPLSELVRDRPAPRPAQAPAERLSADQRAILGDDTADARIVLLNKQVATLREQLAEARKHAATPKPAPATPPALIAGIAAAALILGLVVGVLLARPEPATPLITVVAARSEALGDLEYAYAGRSGPVPTAQDVEDAKNQLRNADDQLGQQAYARAKEYLRFCIEIADLPECHKRLATLLALEGHPSSRTHLEHYLRIAPSAPDAASIRKGLDLGDE